MSLIDNAFKNNSDFKAGYEVAKVESYFANEIKFGMKLHPGSKRYILELAESSSAIYFIDEFGYINVIGYINLN